MKHPIRHNLPEHHRKDYKGLLYFIMLGIISLVWFLIRVIPKPSRITYPCQRVAAANSVAFISWLLSMIFGITLFKTALKKLRKAKVPLAIVLLVFSMLLVGISFLLSPAPNGLALSRADIIPYNPTDLNQPIGVARGIFPGRVVWAHDSDAVVYDPAASNGFWWEDQNTIPEKVDRMFSSALDGVTGATTAYDGWDKLFRNTNIRNGKGDLPYSPGERIAIKVNLLMGLGGGKERANAPGPTPQLLMAVIRDLILEVGVPGEYITVYDASARIPDYIMLPFKDHDNPEFRKVRFVGNPGYNDDNRYISARADLNAKIYFADTTVTDVFWVKSVTEADYLINIGNLKAHTMAGVTLVSKNLYGSIYIPTATREFWSNSYTYGFGPNNLTDSLGNPDPHRGLHKCAAVHDFQDGNIGFLPAREMGTYNYLVDILGHPEINEKAVLYIIDAFYGASDQGTISRFKSFDDHYTASIFMSQDPIALESVGLDFLRNEPNCADLVVGYVDNWLHEAALADDPPSGCKYNPGNSENGLQSLGVHEHWNNWQEKKYTRNLGTGDGIELYCVDMAVGVQEHHLALLRTNYPNPFCYRTTIPFELKKGARVEIAIFDPLGRKIVMLVKKQYSPGVYHVVWDASGYSEGMYFCRMYTEYGPVKTMELMKIQ